MLHAKNTFSNVARRIADGLEQGSLTIGSEYPSRSEETFASQLSGAEFYDSNIFFPRRARDPKFAKADDWTLPLWKRSFDVFVCFMALPIVAFVMLAALLFVALTARGPVLSLSQRIGRNGRRFHMLAFRTLSLRSHLRTVNDWRRDPRVIPGGAFLRSSGLHYLPAILNVLRGDMSLVGPRPYFDCEKDKFKITPGLSGLDHFRPKGADLIYTLDVEQLYLENRSLLTDLKILARTVWFNAKSSVTKGVETGDETQRESESKTVGPAYNRNRA